MYNKCRSWYNMWITLQTWSLNRKFDQYTLFTITFKIVFNYLPHSAKSSWLVSTWKTNVSFHIGLLLASTVFVSCRFSSDSGTTISTRESGVSTTRIRYKCFIITSLNIYTNIAYSVQKYSHKKHPTAKMLWNLICDYIHIV